MMVFKQIIVTVENAGDSTIVFAVWTLTQKLIIQYTE